MTDFPGRFPKTRLRRTRRTAWLRRLVAQNTLTPDDLIWPLFVTDGGGEPQEIEGLYGVQRLPIGALVKAAKQANRVGIPAIALFPYVPDDLKTPDGDEAVKSDNLICRAVAEVKTAVPEIGIITDAALDPYTTHGHDGLLRDGEIVNDPTVERLVEMALLAAQSGADVIAPSDMMDGRVGAIRQALDHAGRQDVAIMAYSAKYASSFYGPFRSAVGSRKALTGDKKTYQMNPANSAEALREVGLDLAEGADMVMVKPGLPYLDIIRSVKQEFGVPTCAYHVSGEYAMLKAAAEAGCLDFDACLMETLMAFKRAGCDGVLTYGALEAAELLNG